MTDAIGQNDEILVPIQQLTLLEQLTGKSRAEKTRTGPARSMEDQHSIADDTRCIPNRCADRPVMQLEFRKRFAAGETEILNHVIALDRCRIGGGDSG